MTHVMEQNESEALPEKPLYFEAVPITGQAQMKQTPEDEKKAGGCVGYAEEEEGPQRAEDA